MNQVLYTTMRGNGEGRIPCNVLLLTHAMNGIITIKRASWIASGMPPVITTAQHLWRPQEDTPRSWWTFLRTRKNTGKYTTLMGHGKAHTINQHEWLHKNLVSCRIHFQIYYTKPSPLKGSIRLKCPTSMTVTPKDDVNATPVFRLSHNCLLMWNNDAHLRMRGLH